ncbi:MAG: HicB family toxin-antitoxin system [Mycobacteriaceae bacterium]|nr:HicB family toxin-antitoxin system [Mycobacteriaceae bacterium]
MHQYKVEVTRDGRWWMIYVPEIDQFTQARRIGEIQEMAESLIHISTEIPLHQIQVQITNITVTGLGDISARAAQIDEDRRAAEEAATHVRREAADYVAALTKAGITIRDAAELLHVSPQRISQLAALTAH